MTALLLLAPLVILTLLALAYRRRAQAAIAREEKQKRAIFARADFRAERVHLPADRYHMQFPAPCKRHRVRTTSAGAVCWDCGEEL